MVEKEMSSKIHILAIPFPLQGHINPIVQFSKLLNSRGIKVTLVTTATLCSMLMQTQTGSIAIESAPDVSVDETECKDPIDLFIKSFQASISSSFRPIVEKMENSGCPVNFIACDVNMPWMLDLTHQLGLKGMAISTQSAAVAALFYHFQQGKIKLPPEEGETISLPLFPKMAESDLPSSIYAPELYPPLLQLVLSQNRSFLIADWLFFNTFDMLEDEILSWMANQWKIKTIGPMIPSKYLEHKLDDDKDYGICLFKPADDDISTQWLDSKDPASVVYVSFGSLANLQQNQVQEIASGLANSQCNFLWVVRASEETKLPANFLEEIKDRGLIVNWCSQLEVLAHQAVGCFLTHCGWNSTLEALSLGVPMVAMPLWADQPTNAKFIADIWQVGVRVKAGEKGIVSKGEVQRCIKEVLAGQNRRTLQENALKWKKLSNEAINGGSSEKNFEEFISELYKTVSSSL
uniref:Glycosyltransferase n=1 Tax=Arnebia euchroma TaxID=373122 RepID=A0A899JYH9_ARNEU|nr:glycosyltransferase [Arnebia euchroma]